MKAAYLATVLVLMTLAATVAQQASTATGLSVRVSQGQAENLLRTYLRSQGYDTKAAPLDIEWSNSRPGSEFYLFAVYVDTPERLVHIGSYGVASGTGDVWDLAECKRISSTAIAAEQKQIHEKNRLSPADLAHLRRAQLAQLRKEDACY